MSESNKINTENDKVLVRLIQDPVKQKKNSDRIDIEILENFDKLYNQLVKLKYIRIIRNFQFINVERFNYITELVIYNQSNKKCFIVPGEIYKKRVLVNFEILSSNNSIIQISSTIGDKINLYFLLKKLVSYVSNSDKFEDEDKQEIINQLNSEKTYTQLYQAFWKTEQDEFSIKNIINKIFSKYPKFYENPDIKEFYDFLINMENFFVQFLYIKDGIDPFGYLTIKIKTTIDSKVKSKRRLFYRPNILQFNIPFEVKNPYPLNQDNSLHFKINIRDKEKFCYIKNRWCSKKLIKEKKILFNINYFSIYHENTQDTNESESEPLEFCKNLRESAKLIDKENGFYSFDEFDSRVNFSTNEIYIYFGKSRIKKDSPTAKYCKFEKKHVINIHKTLKNNLYLFYYFFTLLSIFLYLIFSLNNFNHYLEIFIGIIITTTFNYINKLEVERYYLKVPFILFLLLYVIIFCFFQFCHFLLYNPLL